MPLTSLHHKRFVRTITDFLSSKCENDLLVAEAKRVPIVSDGFQPFFHKLRRLAGVSEAGVPDTRGFRVTG